MTGAEKLAEYDRLVELLRPDQTRKTLPQEKGEPPDDQCCSG
jgi:hypothetical protein